MGRTGVGAFGLEPSVLIGRGAVAAAARAAFLVVFFAGLLALAAPSALAGVAFLADGPAFFRTGAAFLLTGACFLAVGAARFAGGALFLVIAAFLAAGAAFLEAEACFLATTFLAADDRDAGTFVGAGAFLAGLIVSSFPAFSWPVP